MSDERSDERYLKRMVEVLRGVELDLYDRDGRQGAVDYIFSTPNGVGVVEMTTVRDEGAEKWSKLLQDPESGVICCDSPRSWTMLVSPKADLRDLRKRVPRLVGLLDQQGCDEPRKLRFSDLLQPFEKDPRFVDWQWHETTSNHLQVNPSGAPGRVEIVGFGALAGWVGEGALHHEVFDMLADERIRGKAEKLRRHLGAVERHLAIGASMHKAFHQFVASTSKGSPPRPPHQDPPFSVTHIWITGGGYNVLAWDIDRRWHWRELPRPVPDDELAQ